MRLSRPESAPTPLHRCGLRLGNTLFSPDFISTGYSADQVFMPGFFFFPPPHSTFHFPNMSGGASQHFPPPLSPKCPQRSCSPRSEHSLSTVLSFFPHTRCPKASLSRRLRDLYGIKDVALLKGGSEFKLSSLITDVYSATEPRYDAFSHKRKSGMLQP